ncbi:endonuclease V [Catenuloplanes atrovinosus]|uniref:Endonuclease V n=1 Tax=Catenuloplanes atrovinosus TaxID=137266 RepID=A0AAE4CCE9_9ACTN|nr:endonuclease V [Catenuloplanes atrovinosus]MDR7279177.1 deoxyribonuclease V [Catenuloplanes atrovinosus]
MTAWPTTVAEAEAEQDRLRPLVDLTDAGPPPRTVAGLDVAYADGDERLVAAVVVLDAGTLAPVDQAITIGRPAFPYVPGLFAFREIPALLDALDRLTVRPDLLVCDGHGLAHPRRFGLACHLGVLTGLPALGVGKTHLTGDWTMPGERRGDASPITLDGVTVGAVLRTQDRVRPVFVSPGHRCSVAGATAQVLALAPRFRLPETTRAADHACRAALAERTR